ncbi:MAG: hypothetical protein R2792_05915 [Saprospiraceae bacterium]
MLQGLLLLMLFPTGCEKKDMDPADEFPTQFLRFTVGADSFEWRSDSGIVFRALVGEAASSNWPDSVVMTYTVQLEKEIPLGGGASTYESVTLLFNHKLPYSETTYFPNEFCRKINAGGFESLFTPGSWLVSPKACPDTFQQKECMLDGYFRPAGVLASGSTANPGDCATSDPYDQTGSFFVIDSVEPCTHPDEGAGYCISGRFQLNWYADVDSYQFTNGEFTLFVQECN